MLKGEIKQGDTVNLQNEIERIKKVFLDKVSVKTKVAVISLDSNGGNVAEAMKIGKFIRSNQISTGVGADSNCASACVLVLAAGVFRLPVGNIIIHSFYSPESLGTGNFKETEKNYDQMARTIEEYLKEMRVSRSLVDAMIRVPHYNSKKLTLSELESFGLIGIDPVFAQTRKTNIKID